MFRLQSKIHSGLTKQYQVPIKGVEGETSFKWEFVYNMVFEVLWDIRDACRQKLRRV